MRQSAQAAATAAPASTKLMTLHHPRDGVLKRVGPLWFRVRQKRLDPPSSPAGPEHGLAAGAELAVRFPLGEAVPLCHAIPDFENGLQVLGRTGEVPVGFHLVADLVIVLLVLMLLLLRVIGGFVDVLPAASGVERGDTLLGELEMVGSIVVPLFRLGVGPDGAPPGAGNLDQQVVQR